MAAPVLIFGAFPTPGLLMLLLSLPLLVMLPAVLNRTGGRIPVSEPTLIALFAASVMWSDIPDYSAERLRTYLVLAVATVVACSLLSGAAILKYLAISMGILVGSSLVFLAIDPSTRQFPGLDGLVFSAQYGKNIYGGVLVAALVVVLSERRRISVALVPLLGTLIFLNRSVTAWATALFLAAAILILRQIRGRVPSSSAKPVMVTMLVSMVAGIAALVLTDAPSLLGAVGKDTTLSRRTDIWAACWDQIKEAPLLGHGAFAFLNEDSGSPVTRYVASQFLNFQPPHPHNAVLDLWGQLGLAGLVTFAVILLMTLRRGLDQAISGSAPGVAGVGLVAFVILFGISEPTLTGPWFVLILIAMGMVNAPPSTGHAAAADRRSASESEQTPHDYEQVSK